MKALVLRGPGDFAIKTHTFCLDDFAEGLATFNERRDGAIKVIIEP